MFVFFFFSSRRRHTRLQGDWSSDVCSSDLRRPGRVQSQGQRRDEERHGQERRGPAQERRRAAAPEEGLAAARAEGARQSAALPRLQEYGCHEGDAYADVKRRDQSDQKTGHPEVPPFLRKGIGRRPAYHWACGSVNRPGSAARRASPIAMKRSALSEAPP